MIIDELRLIQEEHGYLTGEALRALSVRTGTPLYHLQGVASFFPHFRLAPPPAVDLGICTDISCHLRGAAPLYRAMEARNAEFSPRGVTLRELSCLGQCDRAPSASINDAIVTRLTPETLSAHIETALAGGRLPSVEITPVSGPLLIDPYGGEHTYDALRAARAHLSPEQVLGTLKASELRGLGGAGFATATKWEIVRSAPGDEKYIVCNADESEPGTIKDRFILEHLPHLVIEGILIAGAVTGATKGIIYIRHEYDTQRAVLEEELERCRGDGLVGGAGFDLTIFVSPGGYICGEESALLEALQGNRAEPRNKPPFPGIHGLWNKPTVINNVETLAMVPVILRRGADWFRAQGRGGAPGLKFVGISGHVAKPGVYEIAMGTTAGELVERAGGVLGGKPLKAWAPSGPSSGYLPASMINTPLDFKSLAAAGSMLGSGAIVLCAEGTCMLDMALSAVRFFKNESCGKCVPCRVGSAKLLDILRAVSQGRGHLGDFNLINDLAETMALTSICGLGQVVPAPIRTVMQHFKDEVDAHVLRKECPSRVCPMT